MDAVIGKIKHCGNLSEFLLKRLLYRHSNMGDSSDSDAEEDSKLREALDSETMTDDLYSKHSASNKDSVVSNNGTSINLPSGKLGELVNTETSTGSEILSLLRISEFFQFI